MITSSVDNPTTRAPGEISARCSVTSSMTAPAPTTVFASSPPVTRGPIADEHVPCQSHPLDARGGRQRMLRGEPVAVFGHGSQQRDYVDVADVVEGAVHAASGTPAACLIETGIGRSTQTIFDALARLTGYEREAEHEPQRPGDIQRIYLDSARAQQVWGWIPRVPIEEGLARTVEWFRTRQL